MKESVFSLKLISIQTQSKEQFNDILADLRDVSVVELFRLKPLEYF